MSTKVESIQQVQSVLTDESQQVRILRHLRDNQTAHGMTRDQIATDLGMLSSSVCGRLNELVAAGKVRVSDNTWSVKTNRSVNTYRALYNEVT